MAQNPTQISTTPPLPGLTLVQTTNGALETIATDFAGSVDPAADAFPYAVWADTSTGDLKRRNAADTTWETIGRIFPQTTENSDGDVGVAGDLAVLGNLQINGQFLSPATGFRNRIINGGMVIDQRNAGAGVAASSAVYVMDRWTATNVNAVAGAWTANQQSISNLAGFNFAYNVNVTTAETSPAANYGANLSQNIEGLNIADFAFGTASAKSITLSFWVYSAVTGTLSGGVSNSAVNRAYVFTYSVSSANTWEYKTVTIPGDTSGTWLTTNGIGMRVIFDLGSGSDLESTPGSWVSSNKYRATGSQRIMAATGNPRFQITGVQLEAGSVATPFEFRSIGQELALCQRYYFRFVASESNWLGGAGYSGTTTTARVPITFPVQMRVAPTAVDTTGTAANYRILPSEVALSVVPALNLANTTNGWLSLTVASGLTVKAVAVLSAAVGVSGAYVGWSAEL